MPTREEVEELEPSFMAGSWYAWRWCEQHDRVEMRSNWYTYYPGDEPLEVFLSATKKGVEGQEDVIVTDSGYESPGVAFIGWRDLSEVGNYGVEQFWRHLISQRDLKIKQRQAEEEQLADLKKRRPDLFEKT